MTYKDVNFFKIETNDGFDFVKFILDSKTRTPEGYPALEMDYVSNEEDEYITGFFIKTVRSEIPPSHKPGSEGDYMPVKLPDGAGLAFPAVFLYIKKLGILLLEGNRRCITINSLEKFFNAKASKIDESNFVNVYPILHEDIYKRLKNIKKVVKLDMQIATPSELIRDYGEKHSSLSDLAGFLKNMNVDNSAKITIESETGSFGLNIPQMLILSKFFSKLKPKAQNKRKKNSFKVYGSVTDDKNNLIDDVIDLYTDRMKGSFQINDQNPNTGLYHEERLDGIKIVYSSKIEQLSKLFC